MSQRHEAIPGAPAPTAVWAGDECAREIPAFIPHLLSPDVVADLITASPDGMMVIDAMRRCLYANPAACEIMGARPEELLGRDLLGNFAPREHQGLLEQLTAGPTGRAVRLPSALLRPDGEEREIEYWYRRSVVDGRSLTVLRFRDVTETRRLARKANAFAQIASSVAFAGSLEATLDALAQCVVRTTDTVACAVILIDEGTGCPSVAGTHGFPEGFKASMETAGQAGARLPGIHDCETPRTLVIRGARAMLLSDPVYAPVHPFVREATWDTVVSVPLVYRNRAVGTLYGCYPQGRDPGEIETAFLTTIADQAAVAAENARLFVEAQGKAALEERQRLARELHDSISQVIYSVALGARTARTLLDRDPRAAAEPLDYVLSLAEAGLAEMRALIFELRPESLETEGLIAGLNKQVEALRARHGITVRTALGEEPDLSIEVKQAVYRIAQEALHNAVKHARATGVDLRLASSPAEGITLEVCDDGKGFDPEATFPGHLGLRSMRERAMSLGGTFEVRSAPNRGTRIITQIPPRRPS